MPIQQNLIICDFDFEKVDNFMYFGVNIAEGGNEKNEVQQRIMMAKKLYYSVPWIMKSKKVCRKNKLPLYKTIIRPMLCYCTAVKREL